MQQMIGCDLCHSAAMRPLFTPRTLPDFRLVQCSNCGLVYLDPRPSPDELGSYYTKDYYTSLPPVLKNNSGWREHVKRIAYRSRCQAKESMSTGQRAMLPLASLALAWRARRRVPPISNGALLDVGCGNGEQIAWIRDNIPGWRVEGVEVNSFAAQQAQAHFGLKVHIGNLEDLELPGESFDMVSFWHSLEHTFSPSTTLREAHRLLKPNGWIGVEVPNIESWEARHLGEIWYHLAVPVHLYHFSPRTLHLMLQKCGFRLITTEVVHGEIPWDNLMPEYLRLPLAMQELAARLIRVSPWGIRMYAVRL